MADMRWWERLSRSLEGKPIEAAICASCAHWVPVEGVAVFARCNNARSKNYGEKTPGDWGCDAYSKRLRSLHDHDEDEMTPVEIPEWLHRKRTEGDSKD